MLFKKDKQTKHTYEVEYISDPTGEKVTTQYTNQLEINDAFQMFENILGDNLISVKIVK